MSQRSKRGFAGLVPLAKRFLYGAFSVPKVRKYGTSVTPSPDADSNTNYELMRPESYRWFRQDEMVRRCVVINAVYATMAAGFETELEPIEEVEMSEEEKAAFLEQYKYVKTYVDAANRAVNLDQVLFVAQVKRSIYGHSGFEVIGGKAKPAWLLSLQSDKITPDVNEKWEFLGLKYLGNEENYSPEEVLYFVNLGLENDYRGLSDVEPINSVCRARHNLLRCDIPEITRSLWAPFVLLEADTSGMKDKDEDAFLDSLIEVAQSGKSIAVNKSVKATVVAINVNLDGLIHLQDKLEEAILRNFGTPRFLVNKTPENRATAYVEFEAFVQGPVANIQRYFARELEKQWYPELVKAALSQKGNAGKVPVRVKHIWKKIRASDVNDMAAAVASLYGNGLGILAEFPELAFEMMGWEKKLLQEYEQKQQQQPSPANRQPGNPSGPGQVPGQESVDSDKPDEGLPGEDVVDAPER